MPRRPLPVDNAPSELALPDTRKKAQATETAVEDVAEVSVEESTEVEPVVKKSRVSQVPVPVRKQAVKKKPAPKKPGKIRCTDRDRRWLDAIYRYGVLTNAHLAALEGISIDSARKRLSAMKEEGWIEHDNRQVRVWRIKKAGAEMIGLSGADVPEGAFLARMKFPHTLTAATIGILFEKGGQDVVDLLKHPLSPAPKVFITEREMVTQAGKREDGFIRKNWNRLTNDLLNDPVHPVHPYPSTVEGAWGYVESLGLDSEGTAAEWDTIWNQEQSEVDTLKTVWRSSYDSTDPFSTALGYAHLGNIDDPKLVSTHTSRSGASVETALTHQPDGLIVLPHIVEADGTVRGGCYAVEIELHAKSNKRDYMRSIYALYTDPKLAGALWFFDETTNKGKEAKRLFLKTLKEMSERHDAPFTWEEAVAYFRRGRLALLNAELSATGELG
jgi:hypothetical protein